MSRISTLIGRAQDAEIIRQLALQGKCVALVGVSNLGKTALMRHLCHSDPHNPHGAFVYVDGNALPTRTGRAFFILIWRALAEKIQAHRADAALQTRQVGDEILAANDPTQFAFAFERGLALALDALPHPLALCLDDFDEAYQTLEPQVFLNLRAYKDRAGDTLVYVTATECELGHLTQSREQGEFLELLAPHTHFLSFMTAADTRTLCEQFAAREGVTFSAADLAFIRENADGHPGIAQAVCGALGGVTGAPVRGAHGDRVIHQLVQQSLVNEPNVQSELEKIWRDLKPAEQAVLLDASFARQATPGEETHNAARRSLRAKSILRDGDDSEIFSRLFADFVRRRRLVQQPSARGVDIDVNTGNVYVEGKPVEALTDLEFRLLLFLYGRLDHVCDKYAIVQGVWGEDYIDEVDDARIEKLISRARAKIEPDPAKPKYLVSVRGRGYKLVR